MLAALSLLTLLIAVHCDVYLNNPRGSNNKLSEQSNNVQNQNRLFDSQNNAAGGYHIGDDCKPVCQNGNRDYDASKEGAMKGTMKYYQGSQLYVEWLSQHACGVGSPNTKCQVILQYMCEDDNSMIRDGTKRGNQNTAGGQQEPPTEAGAADPTIGQHESLEYYLACKSRERNKGLYAADQNVRNDRGATATRQNPNGNANANQRHGLECPEERDYYPYWHPTPWHDIAVLTDEPQARCSYYQAESQNQKAKGSCSESEFNNPRSCIQGGGSWSEREAFDEPAPECVGGMSSRDNHLGNVRNGKPMYYVWTIPDYVKGRCVLRIRYNITTADFAGSAQASDKGTLAEEEAEEKDWDPFFVDAGFNDPNPGQRRRSRFSPGGSPILSQDPKADFLNLGFETRVLQLQVNTQQLARTFEDRAHTFMVQKRPDNVPESARIVNYNVRGRRGNIVQVYPSVEYDFVPQDITVEAGTYFHFQWVGSDANPKGNAGNGRQGTDRSNLVQVASRGETVPLPVERHTLLFDSQDGASQAEGRSLVDHFAYLNQDANVECDPDENNDQAENNCKQLNGASAYFDGGLVQLNQVGEHHIASTRNNDFSNRSQKATIRVTLSTWAWYYALALAIGIVVGIGLILYCSAAVYAFKKPDSWLFSKRYRPRILRWLVSQTRLEEKEQERKRLKHAADEATPAGSPETEGITASGSPPPLELKSRKSSLQRCLRCFRFFGVHEQRLPTLILFLLNVAVFLIGFLSNLQGGFERSLAFPFAKGAGYTLDLNFALLILPTLKSLQTALRGAGTTREWLPIDDPISFHITIAIFIMFGVMVHVGCHIVHMKQIAEAPAIQSDPLSTWEMTTEEKVSGTPVWLQIFDYKTRFAPLSGIVIFMMMVALYMAAMPCVRRGTNGCARRCGGYKLFAKMHRFWKWIYVLLLLHAPARLWIWFFFPCLFILVDRIMQARQQLPYATLKNVRKLPRDVISLTFEVPKGFTYQAGQYILLGWRGEWHPFTLTSAPEERRLSVHIRAPRTYDWCSALRKRLLEEAPAARVPGTSETPLTSIDYEKAMCPHSHTVYSRPSVGNAGPLRCAADPTDVKVSVEDSTQTSAESSLPDDAVVLQLSGPFGAPAQKVWQFETLMVVGAGIGVTPFASILRSVQLRAKQREAILRGAAICSRICAADNDTVVDQLLQDVVTVPTRIHFYWIVRSQEEFDWFSELLSAAATGPAQDIVRINVFMTGEVELAQVKQLPYMHSQFFGRPNWSRIFKQNKQQHTGEHIGVFLCGSPAIGVELSRESLAQSDSPDLVGGTRFSFFKETF